MSGRTDLVFVFAVTDASSGNFAIKSALNASLLAFRPGLGMFALISAGTAMQNEFASEALRCRDQAKTFAGRPEESFLLRVATAFDELAQITKPQLRKPCNE